jgi:hypothetical protein
MERRLSLEPVAKLIGSGLVSPTRQRGGLFPLLARRASEGNRPPLLARRANKKWSIPVA